MSLKVTKSNSNTSWAIVPLIQIQSWPLTVFALQISILALFKFLTSGLVCGGIHTSNRDLKK